MIDHLLKGTPDGIIINRVQIRAIRWPHVLLIKLHVLTLQLQVAHRMIYCNSLDGATLFAKVDSNKLRLHVKHEMTLIYAKFDADLINISKVTSRKTKWSHFVCLPGTFM